MTLTVNQFSTWFWSYFFLLASKRAIARSTAVSSSESVI